MKYRLLTFLIMFLLVAGAQSLKGEFNELKFQDGKKQVSGTYTFNIISSVNHTWCYDIYKDKKLFIHQPGIPGLPGNNGFKSRSDAEKVARLVIEKLENGEMPPSVTEDELKSLKVL